MVKALLAGAALLALAPSAAQAGVVVDVSGFTDERGLFDLDYYDLDRGRYEITFAFDRPLSGFRTYAGTRYIYDLICPGSPPFFCGGGDGLNPFEFTNEDARIFSAAFTLHPEYTIETWPGQYVRFRPNSFVGGPVEAFDAREPTVENPPTPIGYRLTITAVPEPASWAMMIAGFGLAGAALRRRQMPALA